MVTLAAAMAGKKSRVAAAPACLLWRKLSSAGLELRVLVKDGHLCLAGRRGTGPKGSQGTPEQQCPQQVLCLLAESTSGGRRWCLGSSRVAASSPVHDAQPILLDLLQPDSIEDCMAVRM